MWLFIGYKYRLQILDLIPNFATALMMGVSVYLIGLVEINSRLLILCVQVFVGAVVYLLVNLAIRNKSLLYLFDTVKGFLSKNKGESVSN